MYIVDLKSNTFNLLYSGNFSGLRKFDNGYLVLNRDDNTLWFFDQQLNKTGELSVTEKMGIGDLHGLDISTDGQIFIVGTDHNKVVILNQKTLEKQGEIVFTDENAIDKHHINDICVTNDSIYLSMFSISGFWRNKSNDELDGGIVKFCRKSLQLKEILIKNLKAPHSVLLSKNELFYCDSFNLNVSKFDLAKRQSSIVNQYHGFTRGLFIDGDILMVGQSKMRAADRLKKGMFFIPTLGAGIHIYHLKEKKNEFFPLPVDNIYAIVPIG